MRVKKKLLFSIISCALFIIGCVSPREVITFRGIAIDDDGGTKGLYNPERGFRLN